MIGIWHYIVLGLVLICIGYLGIVIRKSAIGMLISLEIVFNGINLTAIAFNSLLHGEGWSGQILVIFIITVAAAETAVALALMIPFFKHGGHVNLDELNFLKW